jgi:hypothetical protein
MKKQTPLYVYATAYLMAGIPFSHLPKTTVLKNIKTWFLLDLFNRNNFMMYKQMFAKGSLDTFFNLV